MVETLKLPDIFKALEENQAEVVLIGGLAIISHGFNFVTNDVDLCYKRSPQNHKALVQTIQQAQPQLRTASGPVPFLFDEKTLENGLNFTLDTDWGPIDLLGEVPGLGSYEDLMKNAVQLDLYGYPVWVISLEDLVTAKESAGRDKDKVHLAQLKAAKELNL